MSEAERREISNRVEQPSRDPFTLPRFALALGLLLLVSFPDVLSGARSFYTRDFSNFGYPLAYHVRESYRAGEIPLWNPYNFAGLPFFAQWNTLCLYPGSLIYILLPLPWSLNFFNLLHLYLGGLTMFCLARRWFNDGFGASIAGIGYAFGGVAITALMWPNNVAALGWLPAVLLTGEAAAQRGGNRIVFAAFVMALQFLTGAPEIILLTWAGLAAVVFLGFDGETGPVRIDSSPSWETSAVSMNPVVGQASRLSGGVGQLNDSLDRRDACPTTKGPPVSARGEPVIHSGQTVRGAPFKSIFTRLAFIYILALALTAAQWLPFLELMRHSQRDTQYAAGAWTLTWPGLGNFLVPLFRTVLGRDGVFFQTEQQWVTSYYCGTTILLLAVLGVYFERTRRTQLMLWLCMLSLLLALGENGGVYPLLRKIFPTLGVMRYPIKFIVPVAVLLPFLAARGANAWWRRPMPVSVLLGVTIGLAMAGSGLLAVSRWLSIASEDWSVVGRSGAASLISLALAVATLAWLSRTKSASQRLLLSVFFGALVFADLWMAHRGINPLAPAEFFTKNLAALEPRPKLGESRAMVSSAAHALLDATIFPTAEVAVKVPRQSLLLNANLLERVPKLDGFFSLYLRDTAHVAWRLNLPSNIPPAGLLDFLSVSHVSQATKPWQWNARSNALPFFTLVPRAIFLDGTNALEKLFARDFDPHVEVILPGFLTGQLNFPVGGNGRILRQSAQSHENVATVDLERPMILVLSQANYPGWRARVDGKEVPLWTANFAFQALAVPAGRHEVTVDFHSPTFRLGAAISVMSLFACLAIAGVSLRKCKHDPPSSSKWS